MTANKNIESGLSGNIHVFDTNLIYNLNQINGIKIFTEYAKCTKIRLITTELVKNEIEKHDKENNLKNIDILTKELGSNFFINVTEADVNAFFSKISSLSILEKVPYSWCINNNWNVTLGSSYFEHGGTYHPREIINQSDIADISSADITLMAYLIKLYNKNKEMQFIYTDDLKIKIIGIESETYTSIHYVELLGLMLTENLSFSNFIKAVNTFIENTYFSLPCKREKEDYTTKTLNQIKSHIFRFAEILMDDIENLDELDRRKRSNIVNNLKNEKKKFDREFHMELEEYSNEDYREIQKSLGYQNLRNIISNYENNIKKILTPFLNLLDEMNLGWVIN